MFPLLKKQVRVSDDFGQGHFKASRGGGRLHKGTDYIASVGENVYAPITGIITKYGFAYSGTKQYRYIEISNNEFVMRLFYVNKSSRLEKGSTIKKGELIGVVANISKRYTNNTKTMLNHIHIEIKKGANHINPEIFFLKSAINKIHPLILILIPTVILVLLFLKLK